MDKPTIRGGCAAPAGMGSLLLLIALLIGCEIPIVPVPDPINPPDPIVVVPTSGFKVLIVEETSRRDRLLPDQVDIFTSADFRRSLSTLKADLRIWDEMVDLDNESDAGWKAMLSQPRQSLPWLVISGKPGFSGPLPKTMAETVKLIDLHKP